MSGKSVPPSTSETAFSCPHCGTYTTQHWFRLFPYAITSGDRRTPFIPTEGTIEEILSDQGIKQEHKEDFVTRIQKLMSGLVLIEKD